METIISKAHNIVLETYSKDRYVCLDCGLRGDLNAVFGSVRCKPKKFAKSSGWVDESKC